jgi:hypothetical protein
MNVRQPPPALADPLRRAMKRLMRAFEGVNRRRPFWGEIQTDFLKELYALPGPRLAQLREPHDTALTAHFFHRAEEELGWLIRPVDDEPVCELPLVVQVTDAEGVTVEAPLRSVPSVMLGRELDWCRRRRAWLVAERQRLVAEHQAAAARIDAEIAEIDAHITWLEAALVIGDEAAE